MAKAIPGWGRKLFAFAPESLFAFSPESCSSSPRKAFRDHPGIRVRLGPESALNRLASANATNGIWGQGFTYDGFGNLTQKVVTQGAAPTLSVAFDPATNRQAGIPYDSNG